MADVLLNDGSTAIARRIQALIDASGGGESQEADFTACISVLRSLWPEAGRDPIDPSSASEKPDTDAALPELPRRLGRFEIRRLLGHGGFGIVFLALDRQLDREVALKLPRPELLLSHEMRARFLGEAKAAALLDHPGIVPVYDAGEIGPIWFIAAAFVQGSSLAQWLAQRSDPLTVQASARLAMHLADAAQHAHSRGILHRDLKPSNVLLDPATPIAAELPFSPKLTDFGLAKRMESGEDRTLSCVLVGTPRYMAPEQAAGRHKEVGVATDVYGLGAMLYELLSGSPPLVGQSTEETIRLIQEVQPSRTRLRECRVPRDLETICLKCLEKEPARRYQSAAQLADDLKRFLAGDVVLARPVGTADRLWRWCRRRPIVAALGSGMFLSIVIGGLVAALQWLRAEQYLVEARGAAASAQQNLQQAQHALFDLAWIIEESNARRDPDDQIASPFQNKLEEYRQAGWLDPTVPLAVKPLVALSHSFAARDAARAGDMESATNQYNLALELWCQVNAAKWPNNRGGYDRGFALCLLNASRHRCRRDRNIAEPLAAARELIKNVSRDYRTVPGNFIVFAVTANELAYVQMEDGHWQDALEHLELARIATELLIELDSPARARYEQQVASLSREMAVMHRRLKNGDAVFKELTSAVAYARQAIDHQPGVRLFERELALDLRALGNFYRERRDLTAAEEVLEQAITLTTALLDQDRGNHAAALELARVTRELATVFQASGQDEKALAAFARSRDARASILSGDGAPRDDRLMHAKACHQEGLLAVQLGKQDHAKRAFTDGLAAYSHLAALVNLKPRELFEHAECHAGLAAIQAANDELSAAATSYDAAVTLARPISTGPGVNPKFKGRYDKWTRSLDAIQSRLKPEAT